MQTARWKARVSRAAGVGAVFALGAIVAFGYRGNAVEKNDGPPPVQPPQQALDIQYGFEQVASKLRPSVVFIKSRQTGQTVGLRHSQDDGDNGNDQNPFGFNFPGFPRIPGLPNGPGNQFRMMPMVPRHAMASGSGVIVRSDGYILTNDHVVQGADRVTVRLQDGREFVGQVKRDFRSDLAVIKIPADNLPAATLADSDGARVGQWAIAFGSPFGLSDTMTVGVVSSLNREQEIGSGNDARLYPRLIQTDASINPGNSGGPLVDIYGRVVGINVAIESPSGGNVGIGFAIPSNTAKYIMDQLVAKGSVTRGFLGIQPQTLTYDEKQKYGVKQGALVASVQDTPPTPASKAGFQVEDVIVKYDGKPVEDDASLRDYVARTQPGQTIPVVVRRGNGERTLNVTVEAAPTAQVAENSQPAQPGAAAKLGVKVVDATDPQAKQELKLKGDVKGAAVVEVVPGGPASEAGIQPGDVITRLDEKPVSGADTLTEIVHGLKSDSTVNAVIRRGGQTILVPINVE